MARVRTSKVIEAFGSWRVTRYGLENTRIYYPIEKARLAEDDWEDHIRMKRDAWGEWEYLNFCAALEAARRIHGIEGRVRG